MILPMVDVERPAAGLAVVTARVDAILKGQR